MAGVERNALLPRFAVPLSMKEGFLSSGCWGWVSSLYRRLVGGVGGWECSGGPFLAVSSMRQEGEGGLPERMVRFG